MVSSSFTKDFLGGRTQITSKKSPIELKYAEFEFKLYDAYNHFV